MFQNQRLEYIVTCILVLSVWLIHVSSTWGSAHTVPQYRPAAPPLLHLSTSQTLQQLLGRLSCKFDSSSMLIHLCSTHLCIGIVQMG